ncbi:ATP synthase complex assembly protein atp12, partial [Puccinia graminis f. sp. tritici]
MGRATQDFEATFPPYDFSGFTGYRRLERSRKDAVVDDLMRYLDTDTICFQESKPRVLAEMQKTHWAPLLVWLQEAYGIHLRVHEDSIVYSKQSPETHSKLRALVAQFDPLKLA